LTQQLGATEARMSIWDEDRSIHLHIKRGSRLVTATDLPETSPLIRPDFLSCAAVDDACPAAVLGQSSVRPGEESSGSGLFVDGVMEVWALSEQTWKCESLSWHTRLRDPWPLAAGRAGQHETRACPPPIFQKYDLHPDGCTQSFV